MVVRSVLEMNRPKNASANGNGAVDASFAKEDVVKEMHHRIVTDKPSNEQLYQALAWSVHNRLADAFEKTDAYWKWVPLLNMMHARPWQGHHHRAHRLPRGQLRLIKTMFSSSIASMLRVPADCRLEASPRPLL